MDFLHIFKETAMVTIVMGKKSFPSSVTENNKMKLKVLNKIKT